MRSFREPRMVFRIVALPGLFVCSAIAGWLAGAGVAYSGPCTARITAMERKIKTKPPGPRSGPTFSQTLGAQLHYQPTPEDIEHAEEIARRQADAALEAARKADAAGNASACDAALDQVKRLYDIDH